MIEAENITIASGSALTVEQGVTLSYEKELVNNGGLNFVISPSGAEKFLYKLIDYTGTGTASDYTSVTVNGQTDSYIKRAGNGDLYYTTSSLDTSVLYVDSTFTEESGRPRGLSMVSMRFPP